MNKQILTEILIAFSLANLLFIGTWRKLFFPFGEAFHLKLEPSANDYLALILNVVLIAIIFLFGFWGVKFLGNEKISIVAKLLFLLIVLISVNGIRQQISEIFPAGFNFFNIAVLLIIISFVVISLLLRQNYLFLAGKWFCLLLSPLLIITFCAAIWKIFTVQPSSELPVNTQLANIQPKEKSAVKNRVIWIIFDELDYKVPFEKNAVSLPEFEKLKQSSLFATNAIPPAYSTRDATASLIAGKKVEESKAIIKNDLQLKFNDGETKFSEAKNIFRRVKSLNAETALVGWVNPYCRVIGKDLSVCQWHSFDTFNDYEPRTFGAIIIRNFQDLLVSIPLGSRFVNVIESKLNENSEDKGYLPRHEEMMNATREIAVNPNIDLAFIHLPFPHPPNYYNAEKGNFDDVLNKQTSRRNSYFDNLKLTDKMLGEIRKSLENNSLWDNSTVIISSDHQWRVNVYQNELSEKERQITENKEDVRVPFFLKLKGQNKSKIYEKPFNTAITADLILAIMKGEVITSEDAEKWLNSR